MQERHVNRKRYFDEQIQTTARFVVPYISKHKTLNENCKVLEIGCGEGGNLLPFLELGCYCVGVDLSERKIELGKTYVEDHPQKSNLQLITQDIYETSPEKFGQFDVIIMRDVIEHIHNQERFMNYVKRFLKPDGVFFLGFPPWQNPFGGHQQICSNKLASVLPYYHLLPMVLYTFMLKLFGESKEKIEALSEIKQTGISIERFEKILRAERYTTLNKTWFLINPNYQIKFGLRPRKQWAIISAIPYLRNFFTTAAYYLVKK
jgi:2-polyprenyl-3-methyl-5-hydroxy-6-metoxy-1,4-benzoquinol methylase